MLEPADPYTRPGPRWLTTTLSLAAEAVLVTVMMVILAAMWLPSYLTSRPDDHLASNAHDGASRNLPRQH